MDRSAARDVYIYDANRPMEVLGGLVLTSGVLNWNFYQMIEILFIFEGLYSLRHEGNTVQKDQNPLQKGDYHIHAAGWFHIVLLLYSAATKDLIDPFSRNNEDWLTRTISINTGTRTQLFSNAIRARDSGCAITGEVAVRA